MGDVVQWRGETLVDLKPDDVLEATKGKLDFLLIIGLEPDGTPYFASSESDMCKAVFYATKFLHKVHDGSLG